MRHTFHEITHVFLINSLQETQMLGMMLNVILAKCRNEEV
jgi:hypothetical protein